MGGCGKAHSPLLLFFFITSSLFKVNAPKTYISEQEAVNLEHPLTKILIEQVQ